jgi:hypothetical protein
VYYTVTAPGSINGGSITADTTKAEDGTTITLTVSPSSGHRLKAESLQVTETSRTRTVGVSAAYTFTMPAYDVTVSGEFEPIPVYYTVTAPGNINGGSITANPVSAVAGTTITLTISPDSGFQLKEDSLKVTETGGTRTVAVSATYTFIMPAYDVTVGGEFEPIPVYYTVTAPGVISGGSITANPASAAAGTTITLTISPSSGYRLKTGSFKVTETGGTRTVALGPAFTFIMPAYGVTVSGEFEPILPGTPGLTFTLINGGAAYEVSRGTATAAIIIIPAVYNNLPVTKIADSGFFNYQAMTGITVPAYITSIGNYSFSGCSGLTAVFYGGTDSVAWETIAIGNSNQPLTNATIYYYAELNPGVTGNYWRYVDGVPTIRDFKIIHVEFTGIGDEIINLTGNTQQPIRLGENVSASVTGSYTSYHWYIDGELKQTGSSAYRFSVPYSFAWIGNHTLTVVVHKGGVPYSKELIFKVEY